MQLNELLHDLLDYPNAEQKVDYLKKIAKSEGLGVNYEGNPVSKGVMRAVIYCRDALQLDDTTLRRSAGIVLALSNKVEVLYKPRAIAANVRMSTLKANFGQFDVYPLIDGTTIGLYWWNDHWNICTTRSYDATHLMWRGITYMDALREVLAKYNMTLDLLDPKVTYTLCICHPKWHPATCTEVSMVAIDADHSADIFPRYAPVKKTFDELTDGSLGYILRCKTNTYSDVALPSERMEQIRSMLYVNHVASNSRDHAKIRKSRQNFGEMLYVVLCNFVMRTEFFALCQQYAPEYEFLQGVFREMLTYINYPTVTDTTKFTDCAVELANMLRPKLREFAHGDIPAQLIADVIYQLRYVDDYYEIIKRYLTAQ